MNSHFLLTLMLSPLAVWLAIKCWRYKHGWIWETLMGEGYREVPPPPPPFYASPLPGVSAEKATASAPGPATATRRISLRAAIAASPVISPPVTVGSPRTQPEIVVTLTLFDRIKKRASTELWSLLLSAAQVPIVGAYTMLILILVGGTLGGTSPTTLDAVMNSPLFAKIMLWFFPAGHYEGFDAAWQMGQAGGMVIMVYHILMIPVRILWPRRNHRTLSQKVMLLIKFDLLFALLFGASSLIDSQKFGKALDGVTVCLILLGLLFVPTVVLISIDAKLRENIDERQEPRTD